MTADRFHLGSGTAAMFADLGVETGAVLRLAGLPEDLLLRGRTALTPAQFYRCWTAMEEVSGDPALAVRLAAHLRVETFQPLVFAALCGPDLYRAAERIALYKRLLGPQLVTLDGGGRLTLTMRWPVRPPPPSGLVTYEVAFWLALARLGTRKRIVPSRVTTPEPPHPDAMEAWREYLGVPVEPGARAAVTFTEADATTPFLTSDARMWQVFEPDLRRRLADLDQAESTAHRVRAVLVELLPSGNHAAADVARRLALSTRTLQRRLAEEHTSFQAVLDRTRHALARHYLQQREVSVTEIALLLGYDEPRSFYRAFRAWSGTTPHQVRTTEETST
ncbi:MULTISPECIES: AraC family transcriptional regulator [unclassified Streptomyces]|uniref:AraC family transcriptional regulator n=1 Tax=unclassified Streptomyces TaxID=2593676 RepID=UPI0004C15C07|nr:MULTISPECIES: AraC family transcriptional regulator [unclassified Streptomyces]